MPTVAHYSLRYIGVVNQLLSTLAMANDYVCIHEYANIAIQAVPGSADAYYWLIFAMQHLDTPHIFLENGTQTVKMQFDTIPQKIQNRCNFHLTRG